MIGLKIAKSRKDRERLGTLLYNILVSLKSSETNEESVVVENIMDEKKRQKFRWMTAGESFVFDAS